MESEQVIRDIFNDVLGCIIIFDNEGKVTFINNAGQGELGYSLDSLYIHNILCVIFPDKDVDIARYVESASQGEIETPVYRANNTCFPAKVKLNRIVFDNKQSVNIASIINITDEQYLESEMHNAVKHMEDVMRTRNEFVANITHELRTPVNGIKGHVKNLQMEEPDSGKRRTMDIILKCCSNMEKIINDMLDFSKIEAGKFELNIQEFDFRECINHVVETNLPVANEKGIGLSITVAEDIPAKLIGDDLRLTQILNNLISNGMKFTSIGSVKVEVYRTFQKNDVVELTFFVIDTGIGIGPEQKDRLFKSFSQVDGSVTRQYGGTGLGLFVTRQLVELMNGSITVSSERGKGSTFSFTVCFKTNETGRDKEKIISLPSFKQNISIDNENTSEQAFIYGSPENKKQTRSMYEKLLLSVEIGNWEKAEYFADVLKKLLGGADDELKHKLFRMTMSIRKEDYDKSIAYINEMMN